MHFINELLCASSSILVHLAKMTSWDTAPGPQEMFCVVLYFLSPFKSVIPIQHDKQFIPKIISCDANDTRVWWEILLVCHCVLQFSSDLKQ